MKKILILILIWGMSIVYAEDTLNNILNESKPINSESGTKALTANSLPAQFNNLNVIDKDSNDINQLNRKLQVEKVAAEIRKLRYVSSTGSNNSSNLNNENSQTIVTGVAINILGKKIAWLQFVDGGTYMVNIGSKVGKYTVTDISMTGVTLSENLKNKKHPSTNVIFLKRVYASNNKKHVNSVNKNNTFFTPSPVITSANSSSDYVPPIVPLATN